MRNGIFILFMLLVSCMYAQHHPLLRQVTVYNDYPEFVFDSLPINPKGWELRHRQLPFPHEKFTLDPKKSSIFFTETGEDTLQLSYYALPDFLTTNYSLYDKNRVVADSEGVRLTLAPKRDLSAYKPFDGLQTQGNISRAITIGNQQNLVTTSRLDLQIVGKLSETVNLRASIQDDNSPLQNGGYSQKIDEFDQIFIELYGSDWRVRGGDLLVENRKSSFLNFQKKVQGIYGGGDFSWGDNNRLKVETAAALVRGQYAKSEFVGIEGNQGPYKLKGQQNQLYILVVSGSERVFVNGKLLERGENKDYVIDYNAGEIRFTSLFPIMGEMRIVVEYQYAERSYTRFFGYGNTEFSNDKWRAYTSVFTETDIKNQPLQQQLSPEQIAVLQEAGNDPNKMFALSAVVEPYSENKILYRKIEQGTEVYFEYSNNPEDPLYQVSFSFVGQNRGDYILESSMAVGKIYRYIAPINGEKQGDYAPMIQLTAPAKHTIFATGVGYQSSENSEINLEWAISNRDANLFSTIDDFQNKGQAMQLKFHQYFPSAWQWKLKAQSQYVQERFSPIERLNNIEFQRDWDIFDVKGNRILSEIELSANPKENQSFLYKLEHLHFENTYNGWRNSLQFNWHTTQFQNTVSAQWIEASTTADKTQIIRANSLHQYQKNQWKTGVKSEAEVYKIENKTDRIFNPRSIQYWQAQAFVAKGDSAKTHIELGYILRKNDSLYDYRLQPSTQAQNWYTRAVPIKNKQTQLSLFVNYRTTQHLHHDLPNEHTINSRIQYQTRWFKEALQWQTLYETSSGNVALQEFSYIQVEPGLGTHQWIDYNENGIQELEEFEPVAFPDLAIYIRMMLPNQNYLPTHQRKISQSISLQFSRFQNEKDWKRILSKFYLQSHLIAEKHYNKNQGIKTLQPFHNAEEGLVSMNQSFRNSLFFNRGKQQHTTVYSFINNRLATINPFGKTQTATQSHQLQYAHLLKKTYLLESIAAIEITENQSENYGVKNYQLQTHYFQPKATYISDKNTRMSLFYKWNASSSSMGEEQLNQHQLGMEVQHQTASKFSLQLQYTYFSNRFDGQSHSAVAYQMMQGLQPGNNSTWRMLLQKNITKYLEANIQYHGRKSPNIPAVHTGSVQLRAFF